MTDQTLTAIFMTGLYLALSCWAVLAFLITRYIFKRDLQRLKVTGLYLLNTVVFVFAYGLVLKLGLIVMAPILETKDKSIHALRSDADSYFSDFILFAVITTVILTAINVFYLKYFVKTTPLKHVVTLFIADLTILIVASYISKEWYYSGLLSEIERHFN